MYTGAWTELRSTAKNNQAQYVPTPINISSVYPGQETIAPVLALPMIILLDHLLFTLFLIQQSVVEKFESRDNAWNTEGCEIFT